MDLVPTLVRADRGARSPGAAGFSLVEVLIAALILVFILLGIVPLFLRASANRVAGQESTTAGSFARSRAEALLQLPFGHQDLTVPAGEDELEVVEYLAPGGETWSEDDSLADEAAWIRTTRIRQFNAGDLQDGDSDADGDTLDTALPGGANPRSVHLKEIEVAVESPRTALPIGEAQDLTVRVLKAF